MKISDQFLWGGATAANQYDGGYLADGKGLSIADVKIVYVDYMNGFHQTFDFRFTVDHDRLNDNRLEHLYEIIESYIY